MTAEVVPLASRLRQRREELGLTQTEAARQLDVARTAYRLWEMEAAKPAPDRWRSIASWLGISMTAMLLAEELIDQQEALDATRAAASGGMTNEQWDAASDDSSGDFFSQERAMIADQARLGHLSAVKAGNMTRILDRIQGAASNEARGTWHSGQFRKRFPIDTLAPALSRAALATTTIGIPVDSFQVAALLVSEMVTNSVKHAQTDWVEVAISLTPQVLRVEVSDQDRRTIRPRTPDVDGGGWGLALVGELATRWGVERHPHGKTVWIEIDLTSSS